MKKVVIIGAGPAGLTAAETLRSLSRDLGITVISAEPFPPYAPPAMAEYFLTGREDPLFWKGKDVLDRLGVQFLQGIHARGLDPDRQEVILEDGRTLPYDRLLIAAGSRLYAPIEGRDLPGVYNFKSLSAAKALVERVRAGEVKRAVIVGAGFIGVEVAILLRELGLEVTMVEMMDRVMPRMLDEETAEIVLEVLQGKGIEVRLNTKAARFVGDGQAQGVALESGEVLKGDLFVAATGVKPNTEFLEGTGLDLGWGVPVDDFLRTNLPNVYAAGDVAETRDYLTGERYVHAIFPNAVAQGRLAALNMLGYRVRYEGAESMNSLKHLGVPVMAVGLREGDEVLRWRHGSILRKLYLKDGRIVGFRLAGDVRRAGIYHALLLRKADVRSYRDRLLSPTFGLTDFLSMGGRFWP